MNKIEDIQKDPLRAIFIISLPIIAILFLQTAYSVVDAYLISGLGHKAVIAIGYVFNLWYGIQKLGDGIGRSCNVLISNSFGAKEFEKANNIALHGLIIILILSVIIPIIFILSIEQICIWGHLEQYSTLIAEYFAIPVIFVIFTLFTNFYSSLLSSEGDTKRAAYIVIVGNMVNITLDPILIYNFKLGIFGAGIATTIGCLVSCLLFYYIFYRKGDVMVKLRKEHFKYDLQIFKDIIDLAIPLIINGFIIVFLGLIINYSLHLFASPLMSFGYVVLLRIQTFMFTPIQGVSQGVCIVTAHLTGAKRFRMLKTTLKKAIIAMVVFCCIFGTVYILTYPHLIPFFTTHSQVERIVEDMIIFSILSFFLQPAIRIGCYTLVGLKKSHYSLFAIIINVCLFLAFLGVFVLLLNWGELSIFLAVILADITEVLVVVLLVQHLIKKYIHKDDSLEF